MKNRIIALLLCVMTVACVIVPQETKDSITVNANTGTADLRDWDTMPEIERRYAFWQVVRAAHDLNYSINGVPIPEEFAAPLTLADYAALHAPVAQIESGQ